jgi:proline iminopeptidase
MKKLSAIVIMASLVLSACNFDKNKPTSYFDNANRADTLSGGVKLIPITTSKGVFNVWTKRVGNNILNVLILISLKQR